MTKLNNLQQYLDNKLNEDTRSQNLFVKTRISNQFCDGMQYLIDWKLKDIAQAEAEAKAILGANINDEKIDANTVVQSASTTGAVGSPHYNEWELEKVKVKIESMDSELDIMNEILKDFRIMHKKISGSEWLPKAKRISLKSKTSAKAFFTKRLAS